MPRHLNITQGLPVPIFLFAFSSLFAGITFDYFNLDDLNFEPRVRKRREDAEQMSTPSDWKTVYKSNDFPKPLDRTMVYLP